MTIPGLDEAHEAIGRFKVTVEVEPDQWLHLTNPETGRTFWTAVERPLVPPKSLGELCFEIAEERIGRIVVDGWGAALGNVKPYGDRGAYALRRTLYSNHLTYNEKCALWSQVTP